MSLGSLTPGSVDSLQAELEQSFADDPDAPLPLDTELQYEYPARRKGHSDTPSEVSVKMTLTLGQASIFDGLVKRLRQDTGRGSTVPLSFPILHEVSDLVDDIIGSESSDEDVGTSSESNREDDDVDASSADDGSDHSATSLSPPRADLPPDLVAQIMKDVVGCLYAESLHELQLQKYSRKALFRKLLNVFEKPSAKLQRLRRRGITPLWLAARNGYLSVIEALCKDDVNGTDNTLVTPLIAASDAGRVNAVAMLLRSKADVNHADKHGCTALLAACRRGFYPVVFELLQAGADPAVADAEGEHPLLAACRARSPSCAELLLRAKVDPNHCSSLCNDPYFVIQCSTPLLVAAEKGSAAVAGVLLAYGADPEGGCALNTKPKRSIHGVRLESPLQAAVRNKHADVVQLLFEHGVELEGDEETYGPSELQTSVSIPLAVSKSMPTLTKRPRRKHSSTSTPPLAPRRRSTFHMHRKAQSHPDLNFLTKIPSLPWSRMSPLSNPEEEKYAAFSAHTNAGPGVDTARASALRQIAQVYRLLDDAFIELPLDEELLIDTLRHEASTDSDEEC